MENVRFPKPTSLSQLVNCDMIGKISNTLFKVVSLRQRDALMCLHENGGISVRVRRKSNQLVSATPSVEQVGTFGSSGTYLYADCLHLSYLKNMSVCVSVCVSVRAITLECFDIET